MPKLQKKIQLLSDFLLPDSLKLPFWGQFCMITERIGNAQQDNEPIMNEDYAKR
jgi:hypothetical protein